MKDVFITIYHPEVDLQYRNGISQIIREEFGAGVDYMGAGTMLAPNADGLFAMDIDFKVEESIIEKVRARLAELHPNHVFDVE